MTIDEKQIKDRIIFEEKTQKIPPKETLEPKLKNAKKLEMEFVMSKEIPLSAAPKLESIDVALNEGKETMKVTHDREQKTCNDKQ